MDSKDLQALHQWNGQSSNRGGNNNNASFKNYDCKWCSSVDHVDGTGEETHLQTLDERLQKNKIGNVFASVDKYIATETELCKLISEEIFAPMFRDWNGCKFDFATINGQRVPVLVLSFVEGGNNNFAKVDRAEGAVNGIERRNVALGSYAYDQVVTRTNDRLGNRHRQYTLTEDAKQMLAPLFYDWVDCTKKVDNENKVVWKQPNWDKYYYEMNNNNYAFPFGGYNPQFNVISVAIKNIDPDKVLDLLFNHCKDGDVEEYLDALQNNDKKNIKSLKCIRRINVDANPKMTSTGPDRIVTIECMSRKNWNDINNMTGINRELSNGVKFY